MPPFKSFMDTVWFLLCNFFFNDDDFVLLSQSVGRCVVEESVELLMIYSLSVEIFYEHMRNYHDSRTINFCVQHPRKKAEDGRSGMWAILPLLYNIYSRTATSVLRDHEPSAQTSDSIGWSRLFASIPVPRRQNWASYPEWRFRVAAYDRSILKSAGVFNQDPRSWGVELLRPFRRHDPRARLLKVQDVTDYQTYPDRIVLDFRV